MKNNYDRIAENYDWLSRLIFGRNLVLSQTCLLQHIPPKSNVLIVGGGTGWILAEIAKIHSSGLTITYVEISKKMISLAKKRDAGSNNIIFVNDAIENFGTSEQYDIIFTAFLFDNFNPETAKHVFTQLAERLTSRGKWLFADFHIDKKKSRLWQKALLNLMLAFFRVICNIEARKLIPMEIHFREGDFREMYHYIRSNGFIKSSVYVQMAI
jgi:ubiquinone/menaquinone biosynthesis C-methylase UbiE